MRSRSIDPRYVGVLVAVLPAGLALASSELAAIPYLHVALAAGLSAFAVALLRSGLAVAALGGALTVLAASQAVQARHLLDVSAEADEGGWPLFDLTSEELPNRPPTFVAVRGYFRAEWVLDEYAVAAGDHPQQDRPAAAVLVPVTGALEGVVKLDGPVVVARVTPGRQDAGGPQTLRGRTSPLQPDLLATLVQVSADVPAHSVRGVLLDTLAVPSRRDAHVKIGIAVLCMLMGAAAFWLAPARSGSSPRS